MKESDFWTLSIIQCFLKKEKTQRFGNWICFHLQVKEGGPCPVGALRKS
jgi:hypothetical protein